MGHSAYVSDIGSSLGTQVRLKMVTEDDEKTTDIVVEGDEEEITRMRQARPKPSAK